MDDMKRIEEIVEQVAVQFATDENGVFSLQDYLAFKAGYMAGLAVRLQLDMNRTDN